MITNLSGGVGNLGKLIPKATESFQTTALRVSRNALSQVSNTKIRVNIGSVQKSIEHRRVSLMRGAGFLGGEAAGHE
jgi:hypothetical protein